CLGVISQAPGTDSSRNSTCALPSRSTSGSGYRARRLPTVSLEQKRWIVTGASGMLGTDLVALLRDRGAQVTALGRQDLDVTDPGQVAERVRDVDVVVNCAAWTAVDDAEGLEDEAFTLNAVAPQLLARAARLAG